MSTKIEWCDEVWNPITGCSPVSEGCHNCYARRMANRLKGRYGYPKENPFKITAHPKRLNQPDKWKKPRRIFVCSMGDIFHPDVKPEWIQDVWDIMNYNPHHTFMILTKRPERAKKHESWWFDNIWLGVTAENQLRADKRIPTLLQIPAKVKFVSVEPMLYSINIEKFLPDPPDGIPFRLDRDVLQWVICGAETGPGARIMKDRWAIDLHNQCKQANVPFFFKKPSKHSNLKLPREFPK